MVTEGVNVVSTGRMRGIGPGLAQEILRRGHAAMSARRDAASCARVSTQAPAAFPGARVETMAPWLVERMLVARRNGAAIGRMRFGRAAARCAAPPVRRRQVIDEAMIRLDRFAESTHRPS